MSTQNSAVERPEPVRETADAPTAQPVREAPLPSEVVQPTKTDTPTQQASTQPGDGSEVHGAQNTVPFKEQVMGVSQKARGTILGNKELKEHGEAILDGKISFFDEMNEKKKSSSTS